MKNWKLLHMMLNLFEGGAAAGGDGTGSADGGAQGDAQALPGSTRRGKTGEYANVKFGKQAPAAEDETAKQTPAAGEGKQDVTVTSDTREDKRRAYRELVNGEYKEFYTEDTQNMINRRFRQTKEMQTQLDSYQPIIDMMAQRYRVGDGDAAKILEAMQADNTYWEARGEELGMTAEAARKYDMNEMELKRLKAFKEYQDSRNQAQQQLDAWTAQAEAMKAVYPNFDLGAETENPRFMAMLKSGVPMQTAYEVMHLDDIKTASAQTAAQAREKQIVATIQSRSARPAENGASSQAAFTVKDDVSKLSRKDRAEIVRRAARGESISF